MVLTQQRESTGTGYSLLTPASGPVVNWLNPRLAPLFKGLFEAPRRLLRRKVYYFRLENGLDSRGGTGFGLV